MYKWHCHYNKRFWNYNNFTLLPFLEFVLGYSKAPSAATEQRLSILHNLTVVNFKYVTHIYMNTFKTVAGGWKGRWRLDALSVDYIIYTYCYWQYTLSLRWSPLWFDTLTHNILMTICSHQAACPSRTMCLIWWYVPLGTSDDSKYTYWDLASLNNI